VVGSGQFCKALGRGVNCQAVSVSACRAVAVLAHPVCHPVCTQTFTAAKVCCQVCHWMPALQGNCLTRSHCQLLY
jgi:hypothetical protein